jgi:uncharacterized RDD family membrane protein YckC
MAEPVDRFDTTIEIVTPENITFHYHVAGPFRRLPAYLLDVSLCLGIWVPACIGAVLLSGTIGLWGLGFGFALILGFLLSWFYGGVFETLWNGQTPGKRLFGLRVISIDGQPINAQQAVLRNILRSADLLPIVAPYALALLVSSLTRRFQRIGDLVCSTMVIVEESQHRPGVLVVGAPDVLTLAELIPASFQPEPNLARALATYVQRRAKLPRGRRQAIANILAAPLAARLELPYPVDPDLLLCALYHRTFIADSPAAQNQPERRAIAAA